MDGAGGHGGLCGLGPAPPCQGQHPHQTEVPAVDPGARGVVARGGLPTPTPKLPDTHARKLPTVARRHAAPTFAWHAAILEGHVLTAPNLPEPPAAAYRAAEALGEEMALPFAHGASRERAAGVFERVVRFVLNRRFGRFLFHARFKPAALNHETVDNTVEDQAVIKAFFYKADEVIYCVRGNFRI